MCGLLTKNIRLVIVFVRLFALLKVRRKEEVAADERGGVTGRERLSVLEVGVWAEWDLDAEANWGGRSELREKEWVCFVKRLDGLGILVVFRLF